MMSMIKYRIFTWGMGGRIDADHDILVEGAFKISSKAMELTVHVDLKCLNVIPETLVAKLWL